MTNDERSRLDIIEAKVDTILVKLTYIEDNIRDHENRMRSVERWKLSVPISVLLALATVIGGIATKF